MSFDFELYFSGICLFEFNEDNTSCTVHVPTATFPEGLELQPSQSPFPHLPQLCVSRRNVVEQRGSTRAPEESKPDPTSEELAIFHLVGDELTLEVSGAGPLVVDQSADHGVHHALPIEDLVRVSNLSSATFDPRRSIARLQFSIGELALAEFGKVAGRPVVYSFLPFDESGVTRLTARSLAEVLVLRLTGLEHPVVFRSANPLRPPIVLGPEPGVDEKTVRASFTSLHETPLKMRRAIYDVLWYYKMYNFNPMNVNLRNLVLPWSRKTAGARTGGSVDCPPGRIGGALAAGAPLRMEAHAAPSHDTEKRVRGRWTVAQELSQKFEGHALTERFLAEIGSTRNAGLEYLYGLPQDILHLAGLDAEAVRRLLESDGSQVVQDPNRDPLPNCVALADDQGYFHASGVLIAADIVLTAGHAIADGFYSSIYVGIDSGSGPGILGHDKEIIAGYTNSPSWTNDLGLILLREPASEFRSITFASSAEVEKLLADARRESVKARVVGFGPSEDRPYGKKNWIEPLIWGSQDGFFFAGQAGLDTREGDSGGPALIQVGNTWKLAGITSKPSAALPNGVRGGAYQRIDLLQAEIKAAIQALRDRNP